MAAEPINDRVDVSPRGSPRRRWSGERLLGGFLVVFFAACIVIVLLATIEGAEDARRRGFLVDCAKHRPLEACRADWRGLSEER